MSETELDVIITGYYPKNDKMQGGFFDCVGHPLKTLSSYVRDSPNNSHVSLAVDPKVIKKGSLINIEGFNDKDGVPILFYACDVGKLIKGKHVDICCGSKEQAYAITTNQPRKLKIIGFHELRP